MQNVKCKIQKSKCADGGILHFDFYLLRFAFCIPLCWRQKARRVASKTLRFQNFQFEVFPSASSPLWLAPAAFGSIAEAIAVAEPRMVKITGAGGCAGMEGYQSGVLISPEGHILTAYTYALDTDYITVVLADGRKFDAKLLAPNRGWRSPC